MKKFLQKKLNNEKGMTLIELLAVIVIIAIIAAIAIPAIGNIIENSRIDAVKSDALNVLNAAALYESQEGAIPTAGVGVDALVTMGFLEDKGELASATVFAGPTIVATSNPIVSGNALTIGTTANKATKTFITNSESTTVARKALETGAHTLAAPTTTP
jgi:type IV pilus assembly protein PilA